MLLITLFLLIPSFSTSYNPWYTGYYCEYSTNCVDTGGYARRPRSGTACHNLQHATPGCSPVNLKKIAKAGLRAVEWGQQAWAGWGGRA